MNRLRIAAIALATVAVTASCGGDEAGNAPAADSGEPTLQVAESAVGDIVVDGEGRSVYLFTQDSPGTSVCEGECLAAWPPVEGELAAGEGVDAELLGTLERGDGTVQATYADWPLYYFAQDSGSGDVKGQGVNDVWYVVSPAGEAIQEAVKTEAPSGGGGGYFSY